MNLRLQALKDMKEDLLMRKCKISNEIEDHELELRIPVMEYNFNDIKRRIMPQPLIMQLIQQPEPKRRIHSSQLEEEKVNSMQISSDHEQFNDMQ